MKFGNRASLLAITRKVEDVPFPEDDTFYRLREMSGTERDKFEIATFKVKPAAANGGAPVVDAPVVREVDTLYLRARLVSMCLIDEEGKRVYEDNQVKECSDELPASVLNKLFVAAQKLNGLDAVAVDAAAKNSESDPAGASSSGSPESLAKPSLNS